MSTSVQNQNMIFTLLLDNIKEKGYSKAVNDFVRKNSKFKQRFDKKEGSIAFRVVNENNTRCLVINSDLGNIPENLSAIFHEVFSLEEEDKILIQRSRFDEKKINNIVLVKSESKIKSFPDKHFDLVVLNGIKVKSEKGDSKEEISNYLKEIKRILTTNGCLCACLENKRGINVSQKEMKHEIYLDTFNGYNSLFSSLGFQVDPYWTLPSYEQPHYSGKVNDDVSLKWFFQNFDKKLLVDTKYRIAGIFLKSLNKAARKLVLENFCPSFVFYCHKNVHPKNIESMIIEKTGFKNLIQNVRLTKIMYFLLDSNGNPKKVVSCEPTKYDLTEKISTVKRIFPNMKNPDEKIIMEEWLSGTALDRLNDNDVNLAMKWLTDFQTNTMNDALTIQDIEKEIINVKKELNSIEVMNDLPYDTWLNEYKEELKDKKLKKTAVHGDFQVRNILIDHEKSAVNIIDWDWRYQEKGNPIYDFVWLATNIMMLSNDPKEEFYSNHNKTGKATNSIEIIKNTMEQHFQVNLDFLKLQRFMILRFITIRYKQRDDGHLLYVDILKILAKNSV